MYECKSCGGNLRFDIYSQQLVCDYCQKAYPVHEIAKEQDAEQDAYDVTVFRCPQCGGEIYSMDTTAAGFCSYCGASTILQSRLEKGNKVQYIIPFKKTKEDCKKAYLKLARRAIFAPKELKKKEYIEEFRGIYMPYWMYDVSQQGEINFPGEKSHRSGDYIITDHYDLRMDVDMTYRGLNYDGAASFADDISSRLAPFSIADKQDFLPGYLCGFYADMSDVDKSVYRSDAEEFANESSLAFIKRRPEVSMYSVADEKIKKRLPIQFEGIQSAMFPVWFLAYRNKDRVAYATVNGQTGKVVADMPVNVTRYFIGTAILSVPIVLFLNLFFTVIPSVLLCIVSGIAVFVGILHRSEMHQIAVQEGDLVDKGKIFLRNKEQQARWIKRKKRQEQMMAGEPDFLHLDDEPYEVSEEELFQKQQMRQEEKAANVKAQITKSSATGTVLVWVFVLAAIGMSIFQEMYNSDYIIQVGVVLVAFVASFFLGKSAQKNAMMVKSKKQKHGGYFCTGAIGLAVIVILLKPVEDYWYYLGAAASMIAIAASLVDLIFGYNLLATRRLSPFDHKGGDDRA